MGCSVLAEDVQCEIWDEDTGRPDDLIGTFTIPAKVLNGVEGLKDDEEINWESEVGFERAGLSEGREAGMDQHTRILSGRARWTLSETSNDVLRAMGCCSFKPSRR